MTTATARAFALNRGNLLLSAVLVLAIPAGVAVAVAPRVLLAVPAALALPLLVRPAGRLAWYFGGGFLTLQSSAGIDAPKVIYAAGVLVSLAAAGLRLAKNREWVVATGTRNALIGAGGLAALVAVQLAAAAVSGVSLVDAARDATSYLMIAAAVVLALDAASTCSPQAARAITVAVGIVAAIGFSAAWISRRGVELVDVEQVVLASMAAISPAMTLSLVRAASPPGIRVRWLLLFVGLMSAVLVTGTRTGLVYAGAVVGIIGAARKARVPAARMLGILGLLVAMLATVLPLAASRLTTAGFGQARLSAALAVLGGDLLHDQSASIRARAYSYAMEAWLSRPVVGRGFGGTFADPSPGLSGVTFTIDSPVVYLAKFGVLGTALLVTMLVLIAAPLVRKPASGWNGSITVARGTMVVLVLMLPFGPPTEDKGFAFAIACLVLLVATSIDPHAVPTARGPDVPEDLAIARAGSDGAGHGP